MTERQAPVRQHDFEVAAAHALRADEFGQQCDALPRSRSSVQQAEVEAHQAWSAQHDATHFVVGAVQFPLLTVRILAHVQGGVTGEFVRLLRNSPDSPNRMAPVVMVTGHSTYARVNEARDAGVTEFLAKPLTARGVVERLHQAIDNKRPFIRSSSYFGPDRRRRTDARFEGPWRRETDSENANQNVEI